VNAAQRVRLAAIEAMIAYDRRAVEVAAEPANLVEEVALRDPSTLSGNEAVAVWCHYARARPPGWAPPPVSPVEEREIIEQWRELTA
jgi:hypothetical protein